MQAACRTCGFWLRTYLDKIAFRTQGTTSLLFTSEKEVKKRTAVRNKDKVLLNYIQE